MAAIRPRRPPITAASMFRCWRTGRASREGAATWACAPRFPTSAKPSPKISAQKSVEGTSFLRLAILNQHAMRRPIMAGNWKMYKTPAETAAFFEKFRPLVADSNARRDRDLPAVRRSSCRRRSGAAARASRSAGKICIGPRKAPSPAKFPPACCAAAGCQWVIVAHSERRQYFGETEETALKKIYAALEAGLDADLLRRRAAA